jgi:branched-chain amino acid transport system permease protein
MEFFLTLLANGLLIGLTYALVALGFVLIYKASSVFNFAQGHMVMFGGFLASAMLTIYHIPLGLAILIVLMLMFALGFVIEVLMLRPLVGRPALTVIMATLGLSFFLQGLAPAIWGATNHELPLGLPLAPLEIDIVRVSPINLAAAGASLVFLAIFGYFFQKTRLGIAMRAVSDDQQASLSVGIKVRSMFALAWGITGLVAAIGGLIWGNILGSSIFLALIGLKVFPVIILGGVDSILGAILGGLIVGATENLAAGYIDPYVGGGTKDFFPYILMLIALMVRPYGFFGKRMIERV